MLFKTSLSGMTAILTLRIPNSKLVRVVIGRGFYADPLFVCEGHRVQILVWI